MAGALAAGGAAAQGAAKATFAGGCFWCMEPPFDKLPGVISTTSGYMGGKKRFATYEEVSAGWTGHGGSCGASRVTERIGPQPPDGETSDGTLDCAS